MGESKEAEAEKMKSSLDGGSAVSRYINIVPPSERRGENPETWAPAFRLILFYGNVYEEPRGKFYAQDQTLTFATQVDADKWSDSAARAWCADHYPDWPISN
jgi:hypothetical protein